MDPDAIAILLFTSGTTGAPKAAVLRHKHLVSYILGSVEFGAAGEDEATLVSVPPYHVAGMAAIAELGLRGPAHRAAPELHAEAWLELARDASASRTRSSCRRCSARIVDALEGSASAGLPHLRALSYGGGKMPLPVIERAMRAVPARPTSRTPTGSPRRAPRSRCSAPTTTARPRRATTPRVRRRLASVGRAAARASRSRSATTRAGRLEPGAARRGLRARRAGLGRIPRARLAARTATAGSRRATAASLDADGYLFLDGRIDDVIVRGGENLSPGEIEDVLLEHEAVADCAVVGVPDEQWGEAVAAAIVLRAGPAGRARTSSSEWVRERLRSSRAPQRIEFRDELPYNETGKLLRRRVKAELAGEAP